MNSHHSHRVRVHTRHCCFCFADESDAELGRYKNGITGNTTTWCVDVPACRSRHAAGVEVRRVGAHALRETARAAERAARAPTKKSTRDPTKFNPDGSRVVVHDATAPGERFACGTKRTSGRGVDAIDGVTCTRCRRKLAA